MGYTTEFHGAFEFDRRVDDELYNFINKFADTRHEEEGVPGYWCQWVINGNKLVWDGGEKFYNYVEWLEYLIDNYFAPNDYVLNGEVEYQGEDYDDFGRIIVTDNEVSIKYGHRSFGVSDYRDDVLIDELKSRGYVIR